MLAWIKMQVWESRTRISYRAEEDGIISFQLSQSVLRNVAAMLFVVFTAPGQVFELE